MDTEKVRDAAIAMMTSSVYATQVETPEEWEKLMVSDFKAISNTFDLTDQEFIGLPSVLCQMGSMFVVLLAKEWGRPVEEVWTAFVGGVRDIAPPKLLGGWGEEGEFEE